MEQNQETLVDRLSIISVLSGIVAILLTFLFYGHILFDGYTALPPNFPRIIIYIGLILSPVLGILAGVLGGIALYKKTRHRFAAWVGMIIGIIYITACTLYIYVLLPWMGWTR